ncbi:MAG: SCP2 sterol-binding domain-containing protein [Chitinophagales bacterium]|nr:SCP2 sterol-binding domain-containing protein [Chitinophagales bacterium]
MEIDQIRSELAERVSAIDPIGKRLKFVLDGDVMLIDGSGEMNVMSDQDEEADCTVTMSKDTYIKLQQKKIKPMIATLTGKLKVKGDLSVAQKLKKLM